MKELIITIGVLVAMASNQVEQVELNQTIDNIQDMKEWMIEDQKQGVIDSVYADYYIQYLEESEQILISITN
jgi:uncharacterized membrane protein (DUF441 family)